MNNKNKLTIVIILFWILLTAGIFTFSKLTYTQPLRKKEQESAKRDINRKLKTIVHDLNSLYTWNLDNAHWNESEEYVQGINPGFEKLLNSNYMFRKFSFHFIIIYNKKRHVWQRGFDLRSNTQHNVPRSVIKYFLKKAPQFIMKKNKFNNLNSNEKSGIIGFYTYPRAGDHAPDQPQIAYVAMNFIKRNLSSDSDPDYSGIVITGRLITPKFIKKFSSEKNTWTPKIETIDSFTTKHKNKKLINNLFTTGYFININSDKWTTAYKLVRNLEHKPIAVFEVKLPRDIYNEVANGNFFYESMLLIIALIGMTSMTSIIRHFNEQQERYTNSVQRFVPKELIEILNKKSVMEINVGDRIAKNISILFLDIRDSVSISDTMNHQQNFNFINKFLFELAPIIGGHNGFIDKFIGDCFMAIFPSDDSADDAVNCGLEILNKLHLANNDKAFPIWHELKIGVGINSGDLSLGIIGFSDRLEGTVIGDTVNLSSRIEAMTKKYHKDLLISESTANSLKKKERYSIKYVDEVTLKGKNKKTKLYSVDFKTEKS